MNPLRHIVLVGLDFDTVRSSGDKNFWLDLIHRVAPGLERVSVISLKNKPVPSEELDIGGCTVDVRFLPTSFIDRPGGQKGMFPRKLGIAEKTMKAARIAETLVRIGRVNPYGHVHLMDNFGPANRYVVRAAASSVSVTAYTFQGIRPAAAYEWFLRASYSHDDLTIVPYSVTYRDRLLSLGLRPGNVRCIPWGVERPNGDSRAGRVNGTANILWSGYIHPVGRDDFLLAYDAAVKALDRGLQARFTFAFKSECFEDGFAHLEQPGISVRATNKEEFSRLQEKADVFFSPVVPRDVILAPPLTWLEMMRLGVPVVTTDVPGASEAVSDGVNGYVANIEAGLTECLFAAVSCFESMCDGCRDRIRRSYDIEESSRRYMELWGELSDRYGIRTGTY